MGGNPAPSAVRAEGRTCKLRVAGPSGRQSGCKEVLLGSEGENSGFGSSRAERGQFETFYLIFIKFHFLFGTHIQVERMV